MRWILLILILLVPPTSLAQEVRWHPSYAAAFEDAEKNGKPILVDVVRNDCPWCGKLEVTFKDKQVASMLVDFALVKVRAEKEPKLVQQLKVNAYPTMIIGKGRDVVAVREGYLNPAEMVKFLGKAFPKTSPKGSTNERLLESLAVDDFVPEGWPESVPYPKGLRPYERARATQKVFNQGEEWRAVPRSLLPEKKWNVSGGMLGLTGWKSTVYKFTPSQVPARLGTISVANGMDFYHDSVGRQIMLPKGSGKQNEIGWKRTYPRGTVFADNLTNAETGKPFETRIAEFDREWRRYVAFRDESQRPNGYLGLQGVTCASCHNEKDGPGTGGYAVGLVPGSHTVFSDPVPQLERLVR